MRIGINATCIGDRPSGARQRLVGLYSELVRQRPDCEFVVFEPQDCRVASWFGDASNVSARRTPMRSDSRAGRWAGGARYWPKAFAAERFDLFEALHLPVVRPAAGRAVLTLHDVRGLHPQVPLRERVLYRPVLRRSLERVDHVVTVSEAMRQEILAFSPGTPVSVVHNGIDAGAWTDPDPETIRVVRDAFALPDRFVLAVGHFEPRKNYPALIDAMALLREAMPGLGLVIVGNDSGEKPRVLGRARASGLQSRLHVLGGVSDEQLRCIYALCSAVVFPSTYEGFGVPLLEAMAARKPLVLSDIPAFREITEGRGAYFDPRDPVSIAGRLREVLASPQEQERIVSYGSHRVGDFSFVRLASKMSALYDALVEGRAHASA